MQASIKEIYPPYWRSYRNMYVLNIARNNAVKPGKYPGACKTGLTSYSSAKMIRGRIIGLFIIWER